jgi:hypothetical protein
MIRLALALLLVAMPISAEEGKGQLRNFGCTPEGVCLVPGVDIAALLVSNNLNFERAEKAEAELKKLREIKGCAKLEVTEPSKAPKVEVKPDPKSLIRG